MPVLQFAWRAQTAPHQGTSRLGAQSRATEQSAGTPGKLSECYKTRQDTDSVRVLTEGDEKVQRAKERRSGTCVRIRTSLAAPNREQVSRP